MSTEFVTGNKLQKYVSDLEELRTSKTPSKENFTALAGDFKGFLKGLNPFQVMSNFPAIHDLQTLFDAQSERFTDVSSPNNSRGIPHQTESWHPEVKALHARLEVLESSEEVPAQEAKEVAADIEAFQTTSSPFTVLNHATALHSLKERATALQTPKEQEKAAETSNTETSLVTESLDIEEPEPEMEQGSSFWEKAGALALIGLVILAPAVAILGPMLMNSSNSQNLNQDLDIPKGENTADLDPNGVTNVRFVDRATLTGGEVVPTEQGDLYVYEFDSRAPTGFELPTSTDTSVEPTIPMITNHTETSTPATIFDPQIPFNQPKTAELPLPTSTRKAHSTGLPLLDNSSNTFSKPKSVIIPSSVDVVKSLNPKARLPLPVTVPSLDSRDVCPANYTNSSITG